MELSIIKIKLSKYKKLLIKIKLNHLKIKIQYLQKFSTII